MQNEINNIKIEKDDLERKIVSLTQEPFLNNNNDNSMQQRMAELENKVKERNKLVLTLKDEEEKKRDALAKAKSELTEVKATRDKLAADHKAASAEFQEKFKRTVTQTKQPDSVDAMNALNTLDQA